MRGVPPAEITAVPESAIWEALRDLSPFEERGIGMLNELESIELVDRGFLYFRQFQFLQERGAFPQA
jgi:hypothetical protein